MKTRIVRQIQFSSSHRYNQPRWSEEKNRAEFGPCFNVNGHGHNYTLEAHIEGSIDPLSGMILNLRDIDQALRGVIEPLDHHHLNLDVDAFKTTIPTTENVAVYCYERLALAFDSMPSVRLAGLRLYERSDLWAEVWAD